METKTITQNNELIKVIETSGLDKTKAQVLLDKFTGYFEIASEWERKTKELIVNDISQTTEMKMAREARLFLSKKRIDVEKTRKALKEDSLREGQTIDAIAKILKNLIEPIEKELEGKERFAEIKEAERKEGLKAERTEKLLPYTVDTTIYPLGEMKQEAFDELYTGLKNAYEAKIEAEQKAEAERIEAAKKEAERLEAQRIENERLKEENKKQAAKIEAEILFQKEIQAKANADKAKADAEAKKAKAISDKAIADAKAKVDALAAEIKAKADAEAKAQKDAELKVAAELKAKQKAEAEAAKAPKKQKLNTWIDGFVIGTPTGMNEDETVIEILEKFEAFKKWAKTILTRKSN